VVQPDPRWTAQDLAGTAAAAPIWWDLVAAGVTPLPDDLVAARGRIAALAAEVGGPGEVADRAAAGTALVDELSAAGRRAHALGCGPAHQRGTVVGIHVSPGGVPKAPVPAADIGWRGLAGDRQAARRHHGRLWQAVCLWSREVIDRLVAEGHPIFSGAAGENVTVAGIDWAALRPGSRLVVGGAELEITTPALPCAKNAQWFADRDFNRMHHERHPGDSRLYALVVTPGPVAVGDDVEVEPDLDRAVTPRRSRAPGR
jgi:MOSC domain-containing protein YiiM